MDDHRDHTDIILLSLSLIFSQMAEENPTDRKACNAAHIMHLGVRLNLHNELYLRSINP